MFDKFKIQIQSLSQGVAQDNLNQEKLSNIKFIFPTLPEQQKIATFLSSVDEKLQGLNKKKSLLEAYKKGMMQRLFSSEPGLTRLEDEQDLDDNNPTILTSRKLRFRQDNGEDFPEWEEKTLGEVYTFKVTNSFSRENLNYEEGVVKNIHYGDIHTRFSTLFDITKETVPYINTQLSIDRISIDNYCVEGDIILADASEDLEDVGKSIEIVNLNNERLLSGLHTLLARPVTPLSSGFGGFLFMSNSIRQQIKKEAQCYIFSCSWLSLTV